MINFNFIDVSSYDGVVPDTGESLELDFADNGGRRSDPVILSSRSDIIEGQLHLMLGVLLNWGDL